MAQAGFAGARAESVRATLLAAALGGERVAEGARLRPAQRPIGTALRTAASGAGWAPPWSATSVSWCC